MPHTAHSGQISSLQALRALAALLVVACHAAEVLAAGGWHLDVMDVIGRWGRIGVDIFFVISGFVMVLTTYRKPAGLSTGRAFFLARIIRVAPLYWILTAVMAAAILLVPSAFSQSKFDWGHALASLLFIPYANPISGTEYPVLYPGWTLSYEMFFYAVFALLLCAPRRCLLPSLIAIFGTLAALTLAHPTTLLGKFVSNPIMIEFVVGCATGWVYANNRRIGKRIAGCVLAGGSLMALLTIPINVLNETRYLYWCIPAGMIVFGAVFWERAGGRMPVLWARALGDSSYSLYLSHIFILPIIKKVLGKLDPSHAIPGDALIFIFLIAAPVVGYVVYSLIERPLDNWLRSRTRKSGHATPVTA